MKINAKNLSFRSAILEDSDFIFDLRSSKGKFINNNGFTREVNRNWMKGCVTRQLERKEYYFVIYNKKEDVGVVRIYKINNEEKTFTWGSWILKDGCSPLYAITSAVMVYSFAFDFLRMRKSYFDVRNENIKVKSFHEKTGAIFLRKDNLDTFYSFDKVNHQNLFKKYKKFTGDISYLS